MKNQGYIIISAVLAAAVSCTGNLDEGIGKHIEFRTGIETKAFMNSEDINVAGNGMCIWGYEDNNAFISGVESAYDAAKGWVLDKDYHWTDGKNYAFFSYLTKDKDGHTGPAVSMSSRTLTVPARAFDFNATDNDFDFCYSDVVYRPASNADHSVVNLNLKHLYTAIAFSAHNYTGSEITVKEISLVGLKNKKSASINFANSGAVVTYGDDAACTWTSGRKLNSADITIADNGEYANIVGTASGTPTYYMFWPQTSGELTASGWSDSNTQPTGGAYLKVVYVQGANTITKYAKFPQEINGSEVNGWPAGTKRMMQLAFRNDSFTLKVAALPWNYSEPTVKYDDEVDIATALHFDENTCTVDEANHKVYFKGANPIIGSFKFSSPAEATWIISKEGDYDAFEIDGGADGRYGDGVDCNYGSVDVVAGNSFTLYPKDVAAGRDYSIQLSFSIRYPDGESYCIDDKIQVDAIENPVRWTIILTK